MNNGGMGQFLARIETDAGLREELRAAGFGSGMAVDDVVAFAARKGYSLLAGDGDALADDQLDKVAGGVAGVNDDVAGVVAGVNDDSVRLATYMERRSKFMETLSDILKQQSDTLNGAISNLK